MKWIVNLHNMFVWINDVNICMFYILACVIYIVLKLHNAFHMHRDNLEIRCVCMT